MYRFEGKVIAVTGAASGIGLAVARLLAAEGANLSLADLDPESLKEIIKEPVFQGREILTAAVDVRERRQVQQWIDPTIKRFKKPIDGAANIAGVVGKHHGLDNGSIRNISEAEFNFVLDINLQGLFNCLAIELPAMKTGTQGVCRGSIVNTASVGGLVGIPNASPYVASKHAVLGLTKTAAKEEGPRCIRVNAVAPYVKQLSQDFYCTKIFF